MRVALDTNILAYAEGVNGAEMRDRAFDLLKRLPKGVALLPVQILGELFSVLVRKAGRSPERARKAILSWSDAFPLIETSPEIMIAAMDLAAQHRFSIWDSVVLAASAEASCRLLLSQDLHEGFTWNGVTVTNPFSDSKHQLLAALLEP